MTLIEKKGARFGLALLGAAALLAPAAAGAVQPAYGSAPETPGDALSRNLKLVAESPHNVGALIGAGKAALELGDAKAALSFFARAEQEAPRDGWVKKWMGSALVQLEQPAAALKFFRDAVSLGVPDASVAGDRGLAWDISGDPRRAQRDYRLALSQGDDAEITRRLALSLAISGEREAALQQLQPQLERRDRAAQRTRALVLALTGDQPAADRAVEAEMPFQQASALEPFLARLPSLSLADRALAVHLGHFPGNGRSSAPAQNSYAQNSYARNSYAAGLPAGYTPTPAASARRGSSAASAQQSETDSVDDADDESDDRQPGFARSVVPAAPVSTEPRRIPGVPSQPVTASRSASATTRPQSSSPRMSDWSWSRGEVPPETRPAPARRPARTTARTEPAEAAPATHAQTQPPRPVEIADARPLTSSPAPPPAEPPRATSAPQPAPHSRIAEVAAALDQIEEQQQRRRAHAAADSAPPAETKAESRTRTRTASATPAKPARKAPPPEREPARHWVQVAGGANREMLPRAFERLKEKAPKLFAGRSAWVVPNHATNRLLVGPFDSDDDAQEFVNRLSKADLSGFAWTSDAGQKIEKLGAR